MCGMTQYSIHPKQFAIHAQAVYFLNSTMHNVTCLRLSYVSVICRVTYFKSPIQSAVLPYSGRQAAPALQHTIGFNTQYRTSDIAENLGRYISCMKLTSQGKDFEFILTVKVDTRHPIDGQFGSEFRRSVIIAELWRPEVTRPRNFVSSYLIVKRLLTVKFSKFCSESFHRDNDQHCCVKIL